MTRMCFGSSKRVETLKQHGPTMGKFPTAGINLPAKARIHEPWYLFP